MTPGGGDGGSEGLLDFYLAELREALDPAVDAGALEAEWRALHPVGCADFHRFLAGWVPAPGTLRAYREAFVAVP